MASINPYSNFDGKTEGAFNFYKSVFGGEFTMFSEDERLPGIRVITASVTYGIIQKIEAEKQPQFNSTLMHKLEQCEIQAQAHHAAMAMGVLRKLV